MDRSITELAFVCPVCNGPLEARSGDRLRCPGDGFEVAREGGIWRFLAPEGAAELDRFLADYRRLRQDEGWGADDPAYYRALPFRDLTGRHPEIWRIRAASYRRLSERLLAGGGRRVADLGAGNCWLSWRLAEAGHQVAAVDLSDDAADGLGAASFYPEGTDFVRLQAAFDRVPLADGTLDVAVFNGSLHYSTGVRRTLAEARRLVGPSGRIAILDTPVYRLRASGERMLEERRCAWRERYGPGFGALPAEGFLTRRRLRRLGRDLGLRFRLHPLPLGWRWHLAPFAALALGRREPARFPLIVGRPIEGRRAASGAAPPSRPGAGRAGLSPADSCDQNASTTTERSA